MKIVSVVIIVYVNTQLNEYKKAKPSYHNTSKNTFKTLKLSKKRTITMNYTICIDINGYNKSGFCT